MGGALSSPVTILPHQIEEALSTVRRVGTEEALVAGVLLRHHIKNLMYVADRHYDISCRAITRGENLEKALRQISDLRLQPIKASDATEVMAAYAEVCEIARSALRATLDDLFIPVKPGDSPFPMPPLETVEKGLGRDREMTPDEFEGTNETARRWGIDV